MNHVNRPLPAIVASIALVAAAAGEVKPANEATMIKSVQDLRDYPVVEFRYVTTDGKLTHFAAERSLAASGLLRATLELVAMDPTPRSRLRWLPDASAGAAP